MSAALPGSGAEVVTMPPDAFFDERKRLISPRLADVVREYGQVRAGTDGRLWRYEGGLYRADAGERWVRAQVAEILGDDCRRTHFLEVVAMLEAQEPTVTDEVDTSRLNVANGLLDLESLGLAPHSPAYVSTSQLPVAWSPAATCPRIDRFLGEVLPPDAIEFMLEVIGYCLYPANPLHKALLLFGGQGTGKSTLLHVIEALVGKVNTSSVPLQAFSEDRFAPARLFGKLANICGDLDARAIRRTDLFKQLTWRPDHGAAQVRPSVHLHQLRDVPLLSQRAAADVGPERLVVLSLAGGPDGADLPGHPS